MSHDLHPPRHANRTATHYVKRTRTANKSRAQVNVSPGRKCTEPLFDSCSMPADERTGSRRDRRADFRDFGNSAPMCFCEIHNVTNRPEPGTVSAGRSCTLPLSS